MGRYKEDPDRPALREGGTRRPRRVDQRIQCEGSEGLAQLPRIVVPRTWVNKGKRKGGAQQPQPSLSRILFVC